MHCME